MSDDIKSRILDSQTPAFERLILTMAYLRSDKGCAWDRKQTHKSLVPYLIEEAHELVEAIDSENPDEIKEELGDLLCQIVFHAQISAEKGDFEINDSISFITEKLIERHPHIFKEEKDLEPEEVRQQWEKIKLEKSDGASKSALAGLPKGMPALLMAFRMGEKAGGVGFDWKNDQDVISKIEEEVAEIKKETLSGNKNRLTVEVGDLLFAVASFARKSGIDPEAALRQALKKFQERFENLEKEVDRENKKLYNLRPEELDQYWELVKRKERK
ncbi:MAG: nucleoside triphosphate pyrophosphohydrolase [Candidatus Zixiibacteriota bacterium]